MNGPLHEVQPLSVPLEDLPPLPLPPCEHLPLNQALYLHATQASAGQRQVQGSNGRCSMARLLLSS